MPTEVTCERVSFAGGRGLCLHVDRGIFNRYTALLLDRQLKADHSIKLQGLPSRTRISADGQVGAFTVFVLGMRHGADPDHLARILDNLINNALTYTIGAPWVRIAVSSGPPSEITVIDHGLGIPEAHRDNIFERFYRVDHPELPRQAGTGLGLAISRELAERHGGNLELMPTEIGAGFRLTLPPI